MRLIAKAVLCTFLFALSGCASQPRLQGELHFECLWWSPQQMNNIDPNNPPPKATLLTISKWEYSDPIAVPHPNAVNVVLRVNRDPVHTPQLTVSWVGDVPRRETTTMVKRADGYVATIATNDEAVQGYSKIVVSAMVGTEKVASATLPIVISD